MSPVERISSTDAKNQLNRLLAEVKVGASFEITIYGEPVARIVPVTAVPRRFGQIPNLVIPNDFDDPLPASELATWEGVDET